MVSGYALTETERGCFGRSLNSPHHLFLIQQKTFTEGKKFFASQERWWAEQDSNLRSASARDLQSLLVDHLSICPVNLIKI